MTAPYDLVIVGLGSAGLAAAEMAAGLELRVAAIERDRPGGHRLWSGEVPVAALAATARAAHAMRHADHLGLRSTDPFVDLATVWRRVRAVQAGIAAQNAALDRLRDLGVDVFIGTGRAGDTEGGGAGVDAGAVTITAADSDGVPDLTVWGRFVLWCTGSRPTLPRIAGLADTSHHTVETFFHLDHPPASMVVLGSGAHAVSLAQSLQRLGVATTIVAEAPRLLPHDEPTLVAQLTAHLVREGVSVEADTWVDSVAPVGDGDNRVRVVLDDDREVVAGGLLVVAGRTPCTDESGIATGADGLDVDVRGRSAVRTVYAAGSVTGQHHHPHASVHEALRAVRDMFLPGRPSADDLVPTCTLTEPALARVGLTGAEADTLHGDDADVWTMSLDHLDRARADGSPEGALVVVTANERVVGAHLLAPGAGETIHELALAVRHGMKLADIAALVHVPTTVAAGIGRLAVDSGIERVQRYRWLLRRS
jgi:pyruvate/2-oxoglutarate dehydrogenase complex dihydrolipoamide dehydrogenase (E3) component